MFDEKPTNTRNISHDQKCRILLLLSFVLISLYIRTHLSFKALTVCAYKYNWAMSPSIVCVWFQKWCVFYEQKKKKIHKIHSYFIRSIRIPLYSWYSWNRPMNAVLDFANHLFKFMKSYLLLHTNRFGW